MKAVLLAGGKGTRLRPLTNTLPKPMVPILGQPLLKWTLLTLRNHGITDVIISLCFQPNEIESYFGDGGTLGLKITYVREDLPLGTGGAIKNAEKFLDDTFIVLNSDIVTDVNISDLISFHKDTKSIATISLTKVDDPTQYGVVELSGNTITAFKEKPGHHEITSNLINAGIYVFEPGILKAIPQNQIVSIERDIFPKLIENKLYLKGYYNSYYWIDIGTPEKYMKVHTDILADKLNIKNTLISDCFYGNILQINNVRVKPTTKILGPVYIGNNVEIGAKTLIGPYSVICDNVKINSGSRIVNSIVWNNVKIGKLTSLSNAIVGSNCKIDNAAQICNSVFVKDAFEPLAI